MAPTFEAIHRDAIVPLIDASENAEAESEASFGFDDAWSMMRQ